MAIDYSGLAIPKPEPRKRTKARKGRTEAAIKKAVRAACVERDGYCRAGLDGIWVPLAWQVGACSGPSEWAHLERNRRSRTRGMKPELRHTTAGTAMLCKRHHEAYDSGRLRLVKFTGNGADGEMQWSL